MPASQLQAEWDEQARARLEATIQRLEGELLHLRKAISIINHLAGHELDIDCAMEAIRQVALDLLGCEKVTLFLVFKRQQELRATDLEYGHNVIRTKFGEGIAGTVAKTGKLMNVPDAYAHPLFHAQVDRITGYRTRNILCASISDMNGRIVAVLQALNKVDGKQFTSADEHNIQLFSTHLGNTLSKAKLHDKALREKQRVSDLYQTFKALSGARNLEEVLDLARCALRGILHASLVFVFILDTPRNELWAKYSLGAEPHMVRVQLGQGLVGRAASENHPVVMSGGSQPRSQRSLNLLNVDPAALRGPCSSPPAAASSIPSGSPKSAPATQPPASAAASLPSSSPKSASATESVTTAPGLFPSGSSKSASSSQPAAPARSALPSSSPIFASTSTPKMATSPAAPLPTTSAISATATLPIAPPTAASSSGSPKSAPAAQAAAASPAVQSCAPPKSASTGQTLTPPPAPPPVPSPAPPLPPALSSFSAAAATNHNTPPYLLSPFSLKRTSPLPARRQPSFVRQHSHLQQELSQAPSGSAPLPTHHQHTVDLAAIDPHLMHQIEPVLQGEPVRSLLVQPLAADEKVVGAILTINKNDNENEHDIFFEDCYTESDSKAMALFAYEISQILRERSLECSIASALSVVSSPQLGLDVKASKAASESSQVLADEADLLLRSQMLTMYYQFAPRPGTFSGVSSTNSAIGTHSKPQATLPVTRCKTMDSSLRRDNSDVVSAPCSPDFRTNTSGLPCMFKTLPPGFGRHTSANQPSVQFGSPCGSHVRSHTVGRAPWDENTSSDDSDWGGAEDAEKEPGQVQGRVSVDMCSTAAQSVAEARSVLDEVAPWVDLTCSSKDSSRGGGDGSRGGEDGSRSSSSSSSSDDAVQPLQQQQQQLATADDSKHRQPGKARNSIDALPPPTPQQQLRWNSSPIPSVRFEDRPKSQCSMPICDSSLAYAVPPPPRSDRTHTFATVTQRPPRGSPSPKGTNLTFYHNPQLPRAALAGSRKPSLQPVCAVPPHHAAAQQANVWWPGMDGSVPLADPACAVLWGGRPFKHPTNFPVDLLCSWHFDFTAFGTEDLVKLSEDLFVLSGVVEEFALDPTWLHCFITVVAQHYNDAPYHNLNHVVHVLHSTFLMLGTPSVQKVLTPEDNLALLVAALCHDLGHDGYSNSYHVNIQSELATTYNDISVQENYHCATCFSILRSKECAILEHLDAGLQRRLRKAIVGAIMSTDMAKHFEHCQAFNQHPPRYDKDSEADRLLLIKVLLHAADIGNAVRPFHVNQIMSRRVHKEFEAQARDEAAAGLPITFAVDSNNPRMCAQVELNFLDYVVSPLWTRLAEVLPVFTEQLNQLKSNRQHYEELANLEPNQEPS